MAGPEERENVDPEQAAAAALFAETPPDEEPENLPEPVEVKLDEKPAGKDEKPAREPPIDDGKAELQRQFAQQRARTEQAEQWARQEQQRALNAEQNAANASLQMLDSALLAAAQASEAARDKYTKAMEAGNFRAAADAQDEIAAARVNYNTYYYQKEALAQQIAQAQQRPQQSPFQHPAQRQIPLSETVAEQLARNGSVKSAEWVRAHSDLANDPNQMRKIQSAANYAADILNIPVESQEYFEEIERQLGLRQEQPRQQQSAPLRTAPPRAAPPTPARTNLSGVTERSSITLSPRQRQFARDVLGMSDEAYAKELARGIAEGKVGGTRR